MKMPDPETKRSKEKGAERKPVIGLVPLVDREKESYWMLPGYMKGIEAAGGLPVMMPLTENRELVRQMAEELDGFLLTGGHDVSPELYGADRSPDCGACSKERDQMECILLEEVLERDKPIFGICRGIQLLNAALGGTLYQDLPTEYSSSQEHHQSPPYDRPVHRVQIQEGTPLFSLLGKQELEVNSYHHQAIKVLSPQLSEMARSQDGLIEGVYMPAKTFVWAVQWHPEFSFLKDEDSRQLLYAFVKAAKERSMQF